MDEQCYPIAVVPGTTALVRDFADVAAAADPAALRRWYPSDPLGWAWAANAPELDETHRQRLADALREQATRFGAGAKVFENIEKLKDGAAAVVTGQQVALFGGPLFTLLKAATAIRKAQEATERSGRPHVPVFWLATEDHDLAEVDQVALPVKREVETLRLELHPGVAGRVGAMAADGGSEEGRAKLNAVLERAGELLGWGPVAEDLRACYEKPGTTLAEGFARLLTKIFAEFGLVVMDASSRAFHALGARALRAAVERAEELEAALMARAEELVSAGYHAQVLVAAGHSLLFLIDGESGARLPLRRGTDGQWKAGARAYSTEELLAILEAEPERVSPNALLRPVFQDAILPTAAYVAGPAEIAYFAQSGVVYERVLGRVTPVLPRLSATLVEPAVAKVMAQHEVELPQVWEAKSAEALAQRLGARAMPVETKRKLAAAGNALDVELTALTEHMNAMSEELGRAAEVSASKMRYQMNRLRTMAANFQLQREASLRKHAEALMVNLLPEGHLQERVLGGVWFLARYGEGLPRLLVECAGQECPGHRLIYI
ncbi:MAG TPA: bacillithiol biosynthesis cysteine-adding enzyme BshC [Acidobacteriaceae bacterium]|jgi:bacillithiol biosynthesis cysteine-adding enzyme BshC|nr:bacillithiol biosynthesis cysteine-adding enzyme BshC [Acidobacteriaceae bacterium]